MYQICKHGKQDGEPCGECQKIVEKGLSARPSGCELAARACAYAASGYFDDLYMAACSVGKPFTSSGTRIADMTAIFKKCIEEHCR